MLPAVRQDKIPLPAPPAQQNVTNKLVSQGIPGQGSKGRGIIVGMLHLLFFKFMHKVN